MTNKHIGIGLRLRLFESTVTPTVMYSLDSSPLSSALMEQLDRTQRRMLRRMVGWVYKSDKTFEERGHRMKERLARAMSIFPVKSWSEQVRARKTSLMNSMHELPQTKQQAFSWDPPSCAHLNNGHAKRARGRPCMRWHEL